MITWQKAVLDEERKVVPFNKGSMVYETSSSARSFLKEEGEKRAYVKDNELLLFYNSESGNIYIPGHHTPKVINEIREEFLYFISRDSHEELFNEDTDYRIIEL